MTVDGPVDLIESALKLLLPRSRSIEVRALGLPSRHAGRSGRVASACYDLPGQLSELVAQALAWEAARAWGIYWTLNPLAQRLPGRMSAGDADVLRRSYVLIDLDPVRPADCSSTDDEKARAARIANQISGYLANDGMCGVALADSGNGYHLLVPVALPNDEDARNLVHDFLGDLDRRFSNDAVIVDTSVYNAGRIVRLYGTLARKGQDTPERPWRRSALLSAPADLTTHAIGNTVALRAMFARRTIPTVAPSAGPPDDDLPPDDDRPPDDDQSAFRLPSPEPYPSTSVGDDFDMRATWPAILEPHGWRVDHVKGVVTYWTRPGKGDGTSASTGHCTGRDGSDLLYVWSSNAMPLVAGKSYGKFRAWALLNAGGDHRRAAAELRKQGYGPQEQPFAKPQRQTSKPPATVKRNVVMPAFEPFPSALLPPVARELVEQSAAAIGCCPSMVALPCLAVLAGAIGNACHLRLKRGWYEPSIVWAAVVGESGSLKSPAYRAATNQIYAIQNAIIAASKELEREHQQEVAAWRAGGREEAEPPAPPEADRFATVDVTIEALAERLEHQISRKGFLVARDELDAWFGSFTRYKSGGGSDRSQWLELFQAATLLIDRKTDRRTIMVRRASASICGTIQPAILERAFCDESMASGLAARILLAMPPRRKRLWTEDEVCEQTQEDYRRLLCGLLALRPQADDGTPHTLKLTPPAKRAWLEFFADWAEVQFAAAGAHAAALAKLEAYAARFALIHHVVTCVAQGIAPLGHTQDEFSHVTEPSMQAGIGLARWFRGETERIYALFGESDDQKALRQLADWIAAHDGQTTASAVHKSNRSRYPSVEDAEAMLDALAEAGLGCWQEPGEQTRRGRPTRHFVLTPKPRNSASEDEGDDDLTPNIETLPRNSIRKGYETRDSANYGVNGVMGYEDEEPPKDPEEYRGNNTGFSGQDPFGPYE